MTREVTDPIDFNGLALFEKHKERDGQCLSYVDFWCVGVKPLQDGEDVSQFSWKCTHRAVRSIALEGGKVYNVEPDGLVNYDVEYPVDRIPVICWDYEFFDLPSSALIFVIGEFADGHKIKLGEITQGNIVAASYRRLHREMVELLLNPDWEEIRKVGCSGKGI